MKNKILAAAGAAAVCASVLIAPLGGPTDPTDPWTNPTPTNPPTTNNPDNTIPFPWPTHCPHCY